MSIVSTIGKISEAWGYMPSWLGGGWAQTTGSVADGIDGASELIEGITSGKDAKTISGVGKVGGAAARWFTREFLSETLHLPNFIAQPLSMFLEKLIKPLIEMAVKYVGEMVGVFKKDHSASASTHGAPSGGLPNLDVGSKDGTLHAEGKDPKTNVLAQAGEAAKGTTGIKIENVASLTPAPTTPAAPHIPLTPSLVHS